MDERLKIWMVAAWYPSREDAMLGLFVKKHAEALGRAGAAVSVLYLVPDEKVKKAEWDIKSARGGVREVVIYHPFWKNRLLRKVGKLVGMVRYFEAGYRDAVREKGKPDVVLVNILTRYGALAWGLKKRTGIPYGIIEHWSRYLPERNEYGGWLRKRITERVVRDAGAVMTVSECLEKAMRNCGLNGRYERIGNVVDDAFFTPYAKEKHGKKRIVHVSCFDDKIKNISGIVRVAGRMAARRNDIEFIMVGDGADRRAVEQKAVEMGLGETMKFVGEQTPDEVVGWLRSADVTVMFSNYETWSVVVTESKATGTPVVATRVGGVGENLGGAGNGILVEPRDEAALEAAIESIIDHPERYDAAKIRQSALVYGEQAVGMRLLEIARRIAGRE